MKINLSTDFQLAQEGEGRILMVKTVDLKPKVKPQYVEVTFIDEDMAKIKSSYNLNNDMGLVVLSILVKHTLDKSGEIDTDELPDMVGAFIYADVVHTQAESKTTGKMNTYANIKKITGSAEPDESMLLNSGL